MDQASSPSLPPAALNVVQCHIRVNLAWSFPACQVPALGSFPADILSKVAACLKDNSFLPTLASLDSCLSCKEIQLL